MTKFLRATTAALFVAVVWMAMDLFGTKTGLWEVQYSKKEIATLIIGGTSIAFNALIWWGDS